MRGKGVINFYQGAERDANLRALRAQLERALEEAQRNAQQLGSLGATAQGIGEGADPTVQVTQDENGIHIHFGIPAGPQGNAFKFEDFTPEQLETLTGAPGATFVPHMDEDANLNWTNDAGLENPPPINLRGPEGPKNYAPRLWMLDAKKEAYEGELAPLSRFVGAQEATVETVFPGDLVLLTQDGTVCKVMYVRESSLFHNYPIAGLGFRVATLQTGTDFSVDNHTLKMENGVMRVNTAPSVEQDNTLPITSAAVFAEVGNINALLETI